MVGQMEIEGRDGRGGQPWTVLVVEDDPEVRSFFESSIRNSPALQWLAGCATLHDALHWLDAAKAGPDVLLVDLGLPDGSGLTVIRKAVARFPNCEPLVISVFGDEDNVLASIEAGALGYLHKDAAPDDIAQAILDMKAGASPISPMIARRVLAKYRSLRNESPLGGNPGADATTGRSLLSAREQEVLALIARGFAYAEIARLKGLSMHTVQTHIKNLYGKLAVHSKNEAVYEATRLGLLSRHD